MPAPKRQRLLHRRLTPPSHYHGANSHLQGTSNTNSLSSNRHGAQGEYNTPSDAALESEFNTKVVEDAMKVILAKGEIQENEVCTTWLSDRPPVT